jgi:hypothetical protein
VGQHRPDRSSYVLSVKGAAEKVNAACVEMGAGRAEGKIEISSGAEQIVGSAAGVTGQVV